MYFRVNVKMKKPTCCLFTWIAFVKLNFTVACLLIKKKIRMVLLLPVARLLPNF